MWRRTMVAAALAAVLGGCGTLLPEGPALVKSYLPLAPIEPGMSTVQVSAVAGSPEQLRIDGYREAWQYCADGILFDDYMVVWFDNYRVSRVDVMRDDEFGRCGDFLTGFSWDRAPG